MKAWKIIVLGFLIVLVPTLSACSSRAQSKPVPSKVASESVDGIPRELVPRLQPDNSMAEGRALEEMQQVAGGLAVGDGMLRVLSLWGDVSIAPGETVGFNPVMVPYKVVPIKDGEWDHLIYRAVRNDAEWPSTLPPNWELICIVSPDRDASLYVDERECGEYIGGAQCNELFMHFIVIESAWLDNKAAVDVRPTSAELVAL